MLEYRICLLDQNARVERTVYATCADDEAALTMARQIGEDRALEIWQYERVVAAVAPQRVRATAKA